MRRWLFLRSAQPGLARPITPDPTLDLESDMWCALFREIVKQDGGQGQIWKLGDTYTAGDGDLTIRRRPEFPDDRGFDVIFARGGYDQYHKIIRDIPEAAVVYYGAGKRWLPTDGIQYDVVLTDSPLQAERAKMRHPTSIVRVFHKPAAPIYKPVACEKIFDVVFVCRNPRPFKGAEWLAKRLPMDAKVLRIGPRDEWFSRADREEWLDVSWTGPLEPQYIPAWACQAHFGVVCDDGERDSGPRILPELLAMDIPVLLRDTVRCEHAAHITLQTGEIVNDVSLADALQDGLAHYGYVEALRHYEQNLSLPKAAESVIRAVEEAHARRVH